MTGQQTSIDKPNCPHAHGNLAPVKSWILKGRGQGRKHRPTGTKVTEWKCPKCGYKHRTYDKLEE